MPVDVGHLVHRATAACRTAARRASPSCADQPVADRHRRSARCRRAAARERNVDPCRCRWLCVRHSAAEERVRRAAERDVALDRRVRGTQRVAEVAGFLVRATASPASSRQRNARAPSGTGARAPRRGRGGRRTRRRWRQRVPDRPSSAPVRRQPVLVTGSVAASSRQIDRRVATSRTFAFSSRSISFAIAPWPVAPG